MKILAVASNRQGKDFLLNLLERTTLGEPLAAENFDACLELIEESVEIVVIEGRCINARAFLESARARNPRLEAVIVNCPAVPRVANKLRWLCGSEICILPSASIEELMQAVRSLSARKSTI